MNSFTGRVVAITGAGSGIGRALALKLAAEGARLALSDLRLDDVQQTAAACTGEVRAYRLDVTDPAAVSAWATTVVADFGGVEVIVNNAGIALIGDITTMSAADIAAVLDVDFWGVVYGTQAFLPHLIASGDGHVVNISSVFGLMAVPSQSAYNAAKFAVRGFTEALRQEMILAGHPVAVTCVHPGAVRTNIVRSAGALGEHNHADLVARFDRLAARRSPEWAAGVIVRGMHRSRARILVGTDAYAIDAMVRILGPGYQHLVTAGARRWRRSAHTVSPGAGPPTDRTA